MAFPFKFYARMIMFFQQIGRNDKIIPGFLIEYAECLCNELNELIGTLRELKQPRRRRVGRRLVKNEIIFYYSNS